ncbi:MAG: hypothetical protein ACRERS_04510, partial [Methylococcales bacterium]
SHPETLDPDWLRSARFSRRIVIERPDREGRDRLFQIHSKKLVLTDDIDFSRLATESIGMTAADIANLCNEAALLARRCNREKITRADFKEAFEKAMLELSKKGLYLNEKNRKALACYESGHALAAHLTPGIDAPRKLSIVPRDFDPRGEGLGSSREERLLLSKSEILGKIRALLAGRAAEEVALGEISTAAAQDLEQCNLLIREILATHGMSERLPNRSLTRQESLRFSVSNEGISGYGSKSERIFEQEHLRILEGAYLEAKTLIEQHRGELDAIAKRLLEKERIGKKDLNEILGACTKPNVAAEMSGIERNSTGQPG